MADPITVEYKGVTITYSEIHDRWTFELRGIERSRDTLRKAKDLIDKPPTVKEEGPASQRIQAWLLDYSGVEEVTVTSKQESSWRSDCYWIVKQDKTRTTTQGFCLYPRNEHNDRLVEKLREIHQEQKALANRREAVAKQMKSLTKV